MPVPSFFPVLYRAWETHQLYTSCHYSPTPSVCCTTKLGKQISRLDLYHMFTNILLLLWYRAWETHQLYTSCHYSPTPSLCCTTKLGKEDEQAWPFFSVSHMFTNFPLLLCYSGSSAWQLTLFTDTFHVVSSDSPAWQLTFFTDTLCCVVQSLRDSPIWQFTLFADTHCVTELKSLNNLTVYIVHWHPLCYRAKESQQLDSLHCSLTPTVLQS